MKNYIVYFLAVTALFFHSCGNMDKSEKKVNLYSHRHYPIDEEIYKLFTEETGITVNVVNASADELIQRLETEGENSPADLLLTVDASRMQRAKAKKLLQPFTSDLIRTNISKEFIDTEGYWFAMTYRARIIAYAKDRVNPDSIKDYEDLASPQWKGKVLVRAADNSYNQSLMASYIHFKGEDQALEWAKGIVSNMARSPKGSDRDQVKAIAAGEGDLAIVNTYYIGLLLNDENEENRKAGEAVGVIFPNQDNRGTHINVSSIALTKNAPNKENAVRLMEFLSGSVAQGKMAAENYEYPVNTSVESDKLLKSWGDFKKETINFSVLGDLNATAVKTFDKAGWK